MNTLTNTNKRSGLRGRKGSYITEAAIALPIFVIAVIVMSSIILMYESIEDANFICASQVRRTAIEAVYTDTSLLLPGRIENRLMDNNSVVKEFDTAELLYRDTVSGFDELVGIRAYVRMETKNPLGIASASEYELSCITRAYVGKERDQMPMSEGELSGADSEPVYIFPNRGERYHNGGCNVLTAASTPVILDASIRKKYRKCPKCKSRKAENGALVYVFLDEGEAFHISGCDTLERNYIEVEKKVAIQRGYTPCLKCGG